MKKLLTVVGARPQFVKAAVVSRALKEIDMEEIIVHTGQHFDENMSKVFFDEMMIPEPQYNLGISTLSHGAMTGRMLEQIEKVCLDEKPDAVMVYGDTNSTLAGALAASKLHIPVVHVEAGLRSFNMNMPEEINRIMTDRLSKGLFCPTKAAIKNLKREGFNNFDCDILLTGDVMLDAAQFYSEMSGSKSNIINQLDKNDRDFILCTIHRQENTDDPEKLKSICKALDEIHAKIPIVLPIHPRTRKILENHGISSAVEMIDPVGYFDMIEMLKNCNLVITDSGGLQKEAFFFKKPCLTLREETEWTELVDYKYNKLAGYQYRKIINGFEQLRNVKLDFGRKLYGDGNAALVIAVYLKNKI